MFNFHNIAIGTFIVALAIVLNWYSSTILDPDSFYHFRHASLYRTENIFKSEFPWAQYSIINKYNADIWYGYHFLLMPFTIANDPIFGIELASIISAIVVFALLMLALWRLDVHRYWLWFFILVISGPVILFRLIMLRPHPISLALSLLLFVSLIVPTRLWIITVLGFFFSWLHLALGWIPILIYLSVIASILVIKLFYPNDKTISPPLRDGLALAGGLLAGALARPNPLGALKIAYVQVVQFLMEKQDGLHIQFGDEMLRLSADVFLRQLWPLILVFFCALFILYGLYKNVNRRPTPLISATLMGSFLLCIIFLGLSFFVAWRALELAVGFSVIFIVLVMRDAPVTRTWIFKICALLLILIQLWNTLPTFAYYLNNSQQPDNLKAPALWLKEHAEPRAIVFNPHWDIFGQLFFWNPNNYYINGMDPIFEYAYSPALYWKTHYYSVDAATEFTCGEIACTEDMVIPTEQTLRNDFRASYIVIQKRRTPNFYHYLEKTSHYKKVFENIDNAVFNVKI